MLINDGLTKLTAIDAWLDQAVDYKYRDQPLAQDWARISKVSEELGEAIQCFIGATGQNPRKGIINDIDDVLEELADTAWTAILAMQHFTKDAAQTQEILSDKLNYILGRIPVVRYARPSHPEKYGDH